MNYKQNNPAESASVFPRSMPSFINHNWHSDNVRAIILQPTYSQLRPSFCPAAFTSGVQITDWNKCLLSAPVLAGSWTDLGPSYCEDLRPDELGGAQSVSTNRCEAGVGETSGRKDEASSSSTASLLSVSVRADGVRNCAGSDLSGPGGLSVPEGSFSRALVNLLQVGDFVSALDSPVLNYTMGQALSSIGGGVVEPLQDERCSKIVHKHVRHIRSDPGPSETHVDHKPKSSKLDRPIRISGVETTVRRSPRIRARNISRSEKAARNRKWLHCSRNNCFQCTYHV